MSFEIQNLLSKLDNFKTSDLTQPNALVSPENFLVEYHLTSARLSQFPIMAQAMYVEGDQVGKFFQEGLIQALQRGVSVHENIDSYAQMMTNAVSNIKISKNGPADPNFRVMANKAKLFADFRWQGGDLVFLNPPRGAGKLLPQTGRNHMKFYFGDQLGNNVVFAGKMNIGEGDFNNRPDFLVKFTDPKVIAGFRGLFNQSRFGTLQPGVLECSEQTIIHTDSGKPFQSPIQKRMLDKINSAQESIEGVEPFIPDIVNLWALNKAVGRGIYIDITTSTPSSINDQTLAKSNSLNRKVFNRLGNKSYLNLYPGWVHAAVRVFDRKSVIFTTHNLSFWSYMVGTAEWAIETSDQEIVEQCLKFIERTKAQALPYS